MNQSKAEDQITVRLSRGQINLVLHGLGFIGAASSGRVVDLEAKLRVALNTPPQTEKRLREEIDRHEADLRDLAEQGE